MRTLLFLLLIRVGFSYSDSELEQLWASLMDINHPCLEDYQAIERYLKEGKRPYLDLLRQSTAEMPDNLKGTCYWRMSLMQNLKLIGSDGEMPLFEIHDVNLTEATEKRCILLFASYNRLYPEKARNILGELKECGYSGRILFRIGGFPNEAHGGIKIAHVPYAFKVAFLKEAQLLGFKEILWLDTAMHPLTDLEGIFAEIERTGYFFTWVSTLKQNAPFHIEETSRFLNIPIELHDRVPHIASAIIGLHMENSQAVDFLNSWYAETEKIYPNLNWFPEELSLAAVAWRLQCTPYCWFGQITCNENELFELFQLQQRPTLQFYLDGRR